MTRPTRFTGELDVRFLRTDDPVLLAYDDVRPGLSYAQYLTPLVWEIDYTGAPLPSDVSLLDPNKYVVIEAGFISDGVSSPRLLWSLMPAWGAPASRPAGLHDKLLRMRATGNPHPRFPDRKSIDAVFHEAMLAVGYSKTEAGAAWILVRSRSIWRQLTGEPVTPNKA